MKFKDFFFLVILQIKKLIQIKIIIKINNFTFDKK